MTRQVLLIGGGHAHVEVIRRWGERAPKRASLTVIDPNPRPIYSGMVPGYIAGQYDRSSIEIDLESMCSRAGVTYVRRSVASIDAANQCVVQDDGSIASYDIASIDIGSSVSGGKTPGMVEYAIPTRPIASFLTRLDEATKPSFDGARECTPIHIVGGGAGGVEVAFCLQQRLRDNGNNCALVELITSSRGLLEGSARSAIAATERHAASRGIRIHRNSRVAQLGEHSLVLENGLCLSTAAVIWVTGPAAHPLATASSLPTDPAGFLRIDSTLRVEGHDDLFAVGDCASLTGMRKAGVYAVRSGPLIDTNIRARLSGNNLRRYKPQHDFLSLLNLGNGEAIGTKWGFTRKGQRVMRLKDRIDRAFMEKYQ